MTWSAKGSEWFFHFTLRKIQNDREILVARLALEDFGTTTRTAETALSINECSQQKEGTDYKLK